MKYAKGSCGSMLFLGVLAMGCTTPVDDGFTSFTGQPPANTSGPPGVTTFEDTEGEETVGPITDSQGSMGGSADDTGSASATTDSMTTAVSASATTDSMDTGEGSTTDPDACNPPCGADQMCEMGSCVPIPPPACNDVPANYEECLGPGGAVDTSGCGGANNCITVGTPPIAGACSRTPCVDACDCPASPPSGNSVVTCDAITGGPDNFCYLDCSGGETCPTGMICFADLACVWPGDGAGGVPYGDCLNNDGSICGLEGICLNDGAMPPTNAVCTEDCVVLGDCPASPGGTANPQCTDVTGDGANECTLDCSLGQSCPAGMVCFSGFICMWD